MKTTFCVICGDVKNLDNHHIIAKVSGGGDDPENLITLCQDHHGKLHQFRPGAWNNRKQLQAEGIAKAKAKGLYKGRKKQLDYDLICKLFLTGIGATKVANKTGCHRTMVYHIIKSKGIVYDKATKQWVSPEIETIWCNEKMAWIPKPVVLKPKVTIYPTVVHKNTV